MNAAGSLRPAPILMAGADGCKRVLVLVCFLRLLFLFFFRFLECGKQLLPVEPVGLALNPFLEPIELRDHFHHLVARLSEPVRHGGIHDVFDRNAKFFQCHVQLVALRLRDALVGFANVDQGWRFGILNIAQRRDLHIVLPVIPRLALEVELAIGLDVGLRIHRNPVHRAGATRNSLEAVGVRQGPIRPVAARAPAHHAELGRVGHAARDQRITAGHDVVEALAEIIAGNLHAKFLAIIIGAAVIGLENSIAAAGEDVHVRAVAAGEAIHVSAGRTAVKLNNQGIAFPFLIVRGISQDAFDHLPVGAYMNSFSGGHGTYVNVFAGSGYAVFQPNYRGSEDYGEKFRVQIAGDYFRQGFDDIMTGVDALIARGIADPAKLGLMGWSAGGHWSNWTLTHTDRFKAISSGAGAMNWISMYAETDIQANREFYFKGQPWDNWEHYVEVSPLRYIKNAKTPTLIHVGEADQRVPKPQSDELHMALKKLGVPVEYIVYPAMPHGLTEPRYQMVKMVAEFNWFEKWIQGKPDWFDWKQLLATLEEPKEEEKKQPEKTDQD